MSDADHGEVEIDHTIIKIASGQFELESVRRLALNNMHIRRIQSIDACTSLQELNLANNSIARIECLDKLVQLKVLILSHNRISELENLDKLKQLRVLNMEGNRIANIDTFYQLSGLVELKDVKFVGNPVQKDPQYESTLQKYVAELAFLDGEHILLKMPTLVYNVRSESFELPESRPWTMTKEGKNIFDVSDSEPVVGRGDPTQQPYVKSFQREQQECRRLMYRADKLLEDYKDNDIK